MTSDEAKQALKEGKKVRCTTWDDIRYIENGGMYLSRSDEEIEIVLYNHEGDEWEIVE